MKPLVFALGAALLLCGGASASDTGILACQRDVNQFMADAEAAAPRLTATQRDDLREWFLVARSQCRSSSAIVNSDIRSLRRNLAIRGGTGDPQTASRLDWFWPAQNEAD